MTRNLKALGLALLAVCAIGAAVAAASASAADIFTCTEKSNCAATGIATNVTFGTKSSSLSTVCEKETYSATVQSSATQITVTEALDNCEMSGLGSYQFHTNGCDYILTGSTTARLKTDGVTNETDALTKIDCPKGKMIVSTGSGCTVKTPGVTPADGPAQNQSLHGVTYVKEGAGSTESIKVTFTVDGIEYTSEGAFCAFLGIKANGSDGFLTGSFVFKAYVDGSSHQTSDHVGLAFDTV